EVLAALEARQDEVLVGALEHLLDAADDLHVEGVEDHGSVPGHDGHADVVRGAALEAHGHGRAPVAEGVGRLQDAPPGGLGDLGPVVERPGRRGYPDARLRGDVADRHLRLPRPAPHPPPRSRPSDAAGTDSRARRWPGLEPRGPAGNVSGSLARPLRSCSPAPARRYKAARPSALLRSRSW